VYKYLITWCTSKCSPQAQPEHPIYIMGLNFLQCNYYSDYLGGISIYIGNYNNTHALDKFQANHSQTSTIST